MGYKVQFLAAGLFHDPESRFGITAKEEWRNGKRTAIQSGDLVVNHGNTTRVLQVRILPPLLPGGNQVNLRLLPCREERTPGLLPGSRGLGNHG